MHKSTACNSNELQSSIVNGRNVQGSYTAEAAYTDFDDKTAPNVYMSGACVVLTRKAGTLRGMVSVIRARYVSEWPCMNETLCTAHSRSPRVGE
jgi:hypothetical protein